MSNCLSILHVHIHAPCPGPCSMSMFMLQVHVHAQCPSTYSASMSNCPYCTLAQYLQIPKFLKYRISLEMLVRYGRKYHLDYPLVRYRNGPI
jgi:hypothetical protein